MWDLVSWWWMESRPLHWECRILATGSPGKFFTLPPFIYLFFFFLTFCLFVCYSASFSSDTETSLEVYSCWQPRHYQHSLQQLSQRRSSGRRGPHSQTGSFMNLLHDWKGLWGHWLLLPYWISHPPPGPCLDTVHDGELTTSQGSSLLQIWTDLTV